MNCGEELVDPDEANAYLFYVKKYSKKGVSTKLRKVGNSLVLTVPKPLTEFLGLEAGSEVEMKLNADGSIVLLPRKK